MQDKQIQTIRTPHDTNRPTETISIKDVPNNSPKNFNPLTIEIGNNTKIGRFSVLHPVVQYQNQKLSPKIEDGKYCLTFFSLPLTALTTYHFN